MIIETDGFSDNNPFRIARKQLDEAAAIMNLDPASHEILRWPLRELHVAMPVKMDNGTTRIFHGFRVQYNDARGPNKGGIRFHPDETIDTVRALAAWMKKDVPAPDVYTTPQIMAWMADEYSFMQGNNEFGVITGKPIPLGGSAGRTDATARGGIYCVRDAAEVIGMDLVGKKAAIQGYGNAGYYAHKLAVEILGMKVVAVSDSKGGIYNPDGFNYLEVIAHKEATGSVKDFPGSAAMSNNELLELDVDVLFPSALESVITSTNAENIKARIVAELANGPTTPEADNILYNNGVYVIPDFLCNAGGVTVSYFEMVQNTYGFYWEEDEIHRLLDKKMTAAFLKVHESAGKYRVHNRLAAYIVAIERVVEAMKLRGWV